MELFKIKPSIPGHLSLLLHDLGGYNTQLQLTMAAVVTGCLGNGEHVVFHNIHQDVTCTGVYRLPSQGLADPSCHHPQETMGILFTHGPQQWPPQLQSIAEGIED